MPNDSKKIEKIALLLLVVGLLSALFVYSLPKRYHFFLATGFTSAGTPYIEVAVDENKRSMVLDLGSKFQMCMTPEALEGVQKSVCGTGSWVNVKGERYDYPKYNISKVQIGPLTFKDIKAVEKPLSTACILWTDPDRSKLKAFIKPDGDLGKNFLEKINLLLDLGTSRIAISNDLKKLKQDGYDLNQFKMIPIEVTSKLILILVDTEFGTIKLALDTGATGTAIRSSLLNARQCEGVLDGLPFVTLKKFNIDGHDFGEQGAYVLDITEEITNAGIDGLIGMNFIEKHIIYLDFPHKVAYITPRPQD